jgi:D-3-phosphoglycerate dehydrogenase
MARGEQSLKQAFSTVFRSRPTWFELVLVESDGDEERVEKVRDCEAIIAAATPLTRRTIEAAPRLRFVQHQGAATMTPSMWRR